MAAAFIHYFLGLGIAYLLGYQGWEAIIIGLVGAVQDLDVIFFIFHQRIAQSKFSRLLTHRGITHTFMFVFASFAAVFVVNPFFSLLIAVNFLLHIFTDYVTSWGTAPFLPFSDKRYSLGLMTIFDVPLIVISAAVGASGFFSLHPAYFFTAFFGYIGVRAALKYRLDHTNLVPMGTLTYGFCIPGEKYTVGKVDIFKREETISVPKINSEMNSPLLKRIESAIESSSFSHFLEYPTYSDENGAVMIKDARSHLFDQSGRFFTVWFDKETEDLYMKVRGRKIRV